MTDLTSRSANAKSDIVKLYRGRHARCMALAREDRRTGDLTAYRNHMEGAASVRRQFAAKVREMRRRKAEGYVYLDNGFDCIRLFQHGRMLTPDEVRAEMAAPAGAA
jgi:hypothetical protein